MRVCFYNRSYWPDFGATGQLLTQLAEDLVKVYACEVSVIVGMSLSEGHRVQGWTPVRREWRNGVEILRARGTTFSQKGLAGRIANYVSYFVSACLATLWLRRPDVVVALTDPPIIGLLAVVTARCRGSRFVFLCQDVFPEVAALVEGYRSRALDRILDVTSRMIIRKADRVVALGETMRERLIKRKGADPDKVTVIHNWADCAQLVPRDKKNPFSLANGLADKFVVMHSGNVGLSQNLDTLLDAAVKLRAYPDIVFAIVGDGARRAALEARVLDERLANVRFLPYQPTVALADSFASADLFVVALKRGLAGFIVPSKLYGILAAGRPYVAAVEEACEVAGITREYESGLLAAPGESRELANRILQLYREPDLRRRLGANARRAAFAFDRVRQVRAYYDCFNDLMNARYPAASGTLPKRLFDVAVSCLGLALSAPFWLLIALLIKMEDGGPVFYSQPRVGRERRRFRSWKFRSMIPESDKRFGPLQARGADTRITRVGRVLRATAMDELPQLWNILRGEMSFVGPRALMPEEIEVNSTGQVVPIEAVPGYEARHRVTPGLTGIAQIYADRDIPRRQKFKYDLLYIRKQSFWLDLRLMLLSFWITFRGRWEHRGQKL